MPTQLTTEMILPPTTKKILSCESKGEEGIFLWFRVKYMFFRGKNLAFLAEVRCNVYWVDTQDSSLSEWGD